MSRLTVAYAIDESYAAHAGVSIASLLRSNRDHAVSILVLHAGLTDVSQDKLRHIVGSHPGAEVRFERAIEQVASLPTFARFPAVVHMRFLVPAFCGPDVERVLYLDADTLVCTDLKKLWSVNLDGRSVGAVAELGSPSHQRERLGLGPRATYFNVGVILFDVPRCAAANTSARIIEFITQRGSSLLMVDQDAFNLVLVDQVTPLSIRWNVQRPLYSASHHELEISAAEQKSAARDPGVLHYTHDPKPWEATDRHPLGYLYRRIRATTPFHDPSIGRARLRHPGVVLTTMLRRLVTGVAPTLLPAIGAWKRG